MDLPLKPESKPENTNPLHTASAFLRKHGWLTAAIYLVIVFSALLHLDRAMPLFSLWSSIAFPMLAVSPFIILSLNMPGKLKLFFILLVVLILLPGLGLEDSFYLELGIQIG